MSNSKPFPNLIGILIPLLILVISACNAAGNTDFNGTIPRKTLIYPDGIYNHFSINGGEIMVWKDNSLNPDMLLYAYEGDRSFRQFNLPDDPRCSRKTEYYPEDLLPDGRLQVEEYCRLEDKTQTYYLAYDWNTNKIEELSGPLPLGAKQASWNPNMTKAIAYLNSGFGRTTVFWVWKGGFGPADLVIGDQDHSWNLKNFFPDFPDDDVLTKKTGNAGPATWSTDGKRIALWVSSDAINKIGSARFNIEYRLYLMDPDQIRLTQVLDQVLFPSSPVWSPDSKYIAFYGEVGEKQVSGIWLYSIETNSLIKIANGDYFGDIIWRPNGKSLVTFNCNKDYSCDQVVEYDLSTVVSP